LRHCGRASKERRTSALRRVIAIFALAPTLFSEDICMPTKYEKFKAAIKETDPAGFRAVQTKYQNDTGPIRKVWPLIIGKDTNGADVVLCYQYAGHGTDPPEPHVSFRNLRCLKLDKMANTDVTKIVFNPATEGFDPPFFKFRQVKKQTCVEEVDIYRQEL
jgi:hypothetical protein